MRKRTPKGVLFLLNEYKNLWVRTASPKNLVTHFARNNEPLLRMRYRFDPDRRVPRATSKNLDFTGLSGFFILPNFNFI